MCKAGWKLGDPIKLGAGHEHTCAHTEEQTSVSDGTTYKKPNTWAIRGPEEEERRLEEKNI